jgi:head-tail adaptor
MIYTCVRHQAKLHRTITIHLKYEGPEGTTGAVKEWVNMGGVW